MSDNIFNIDERIDTALALQRIGKLDEALVIYREILVRNPDHAETLHFSGLALHQKGQHAQAIEHLKHANTLLPNYAQFQSNLALVQTAAELFEDAIETFKHLLENHPHNPETLNAYATALKGADEWHEAEKILLNLIKDYPNFASAHFNLGNLYLNQGRVSLAIPMYEAALEIEPNAETVRNLASALHSAGNSKRAVSLLQDLIAASPSDTAALNNLSNLHRESGNLDNASKLLDRALLIDPALADAWFNLGTIHITQNQIAKGVQSFKQALDIRPHFTKADWASKLSLPQIYESEVHRLDMRAHWQGGLRKICDAPLPVTSADIQASLAAISEITPFALAYQGADDRSLMAEWGNQISAIAQAAFPQFSQPKSPRNNKRKRIAFVSAHFRSHTIERLFSGWVTGINQKEFDVQLISTSGDGDKRTSALKNATNGSFSASTSIPEIASHLHQLSADIIIYPDIGMDPRTQVLAALPLAKHQAMAWGHPVTSGLPTIDTFLSSSLMECPGSGEQYTENLICLPNLAINYTRPNVPKDIILHDFMCAQSLFKIPPHQDIIFAEIIKQAPGKTLSFFAHPIPQVTSAFQTRISAIFRNAGIDPNETLEFIEPCDRQTFLRNIAGSRVILDTFEWSGGNTSLESFAMGKPVVTMPGAFMRGRHTAAMIDMMKIGDLKAESIDAYINMAIKLAIDDIYYFEITRQIEQRSDCLFDDQEPIRALEKFLRNH